MPRSINDVCCGHKAGKRQHEHQIGIILVGDL